LSEITLSKLENVIPSGLRPQSLFSDGYRAAYVREKSSRNIIVSSSIGIPSGSMLSSLVGGGGGTKSSALKIAFSFGGLLRFVLLGLRDYAFRCHCRHNCNVLQS